MINAANYLSAQSVESTMVISFLTDYTEYKTKYHDLLISYKLFFFKVYYIKQNLVSVWDVVFFVCLIPCISRKESRFKIKIKIVEKNKTNIYDKVAMSFFLF